jgi:5-amino-6-(5-phosphoribosylamino)uracil reductase
MTPLHTFSPRIETLSLERLLEHYPMEPIPRGLRANFVTSTDGAVTINGGSGALSSDEDKVVFRLLRATASAVVVGAGTVAAERYGPIRISESLRTLRARAEHSQGPRLVVIANPAKPLTWMPKVADPELPTLAVFTRSTTDLTLPDGIIDASLIYGTTDPWEIIAAITLESRLPVLCEGGPTVLTQALNQNLVAEVCLTQRPMLVGASEPRLVCELAHHIPLTLASTIQTDIQRFDRYVVH